MTCSAVAAIVFAVLFQPNSDTPPSPDVYISTSSTTGGVASDGFGSVYVPRSVGDGQCVSVTYNLSGNDPSGANVVYFFRDQTLQVAKTVLTRLHPPQNDNIDFQDGKIFTPTGAHNNTGFTFNWQKHSGTIYRVFSLLFERVEKNSQGSVIRDDIYSIDPKIVNQ